MNTTIVLAFRSQINTQMIAHVERASSALVDQLYQCGALASRPTILTTNRSLHTGDVTFGLYAGISSTGNVATVDAKDHIIILDKIMPHDIEVAVLDALAADGLLRLPVPSNSPMLPLRSKASSHGGQTLRRVDIPPSLDRLVTNAASSTFFVVQGGNRYISKYLRNAHSACAIDMKLSCASKTDLATAVATLLDPSELVQPLTPEGAATVAAALRRQSDTPATHRGIQVAFGSNGGIEHDLQNHSLFAALRAIGSVFIPTPFSYPTDDSKLTSEFNSAIDLIAHDRIVIPNLGAINALLATTRFGQHIADQSELNFVDDVLYRGRTLFAIACVVKAFGGDPDTVRLSTLCLDRASRSLSAPHVTALNDDSIYPFENSIRTERGYWQLTPGRYRFVDLERYWQMLHLLVDSTKSMAIYETWQGMLDDAWMQVADRSLSRRTTYALLWHIVFLMKHGLPRDLSSLFEQRGNCLGHSVPFAQFLDQFISQDEPVEARRAYKARVQQTNDAVAQLKEDRPEVFDRLVAYYAENELAIDHEGLNFMFDIHDYGI